MRHSFPHFFYSKINYPITRKEQNEQTFFVFFQRFKTHFFDFDKSQFLGPNHVIQFIDTKTKKHFFLIFLIENHNTRVSALLLTCKRNIRIEVSLHMS